MDFIVDLFRTRQFDEDLFAPPFSAAEWNELVSAHPDLRSYVR